MSDIVVSRAVERSAVSADALVDSLFGDRELAGQLARTFLAEIPGQYAVLAEAVLRLDPTAAADAAHKLKGSVGIFGESDALTAASELERAACAGDAAQMGPWAGRLRFGLGDLTEAADLLLRGRREHHAADEKAGS